VKRAKLRAFISDSPFTTFVLAGLFGRHFALADGFPVIFDTLKPLFDLGGIVTKTIAGPISHGEAITTCLAAPGFGWGIFSPLVQLDKPSVTALGF
jgi:hypothetical protein